ncbi:MAG: hypothetical protein V1738_00730 [Patescibacteria group bacterium]
MSADKNNFLDNYRQRKTRLRLAYDRFMTRLTDIRTQHNRLVRDMTERMENESLNDVRQMIDEQ